MLIYRASCIIYLLAHRCIHQLTESRTKAEFIDLPFLLKFSPDFLHPAVILRALLVEVTTGSKFWNKKLKDRKEANNYAFMSKELLIKRAQRLNM